MGHKKVTKSHSYDYISNEYFYIRECSSITSARLGGGLNQNADTADALEGGGGRSKPK